jgi:hypothetical protein
MRTFTRCLPALLAFGCATARACDAGVAGAPPFTLEAAGPHLVLARALHDEWLDYEREPALERTQGGVAQRHAAQAGTRYRYRARVRATSRCAAGAWSGWVEVRTPREPRHVPHAPQALEGKGAPYRVTLRWRAADASADGFVLERCTGGTRCFVAAVLNPDERAFEIHSLDAARYRITAFNRRGYSAASAPTGLLGEDVAEKPADGPVELGPGDSAAARAITRRAGSGRVEDAACTSPEELVAEGAQLVGVRGDEDLYRDASGCGTGGCIYMTFTTRDGCYSSEPGSDMLASTPPFSGKDDDRPGVVVTNSSGSAATGHITIYDGSREVDQYEWAVIEPPYAGLLPPFGEYASVQFPQEAQVVLHEP